MSLPTWAAWIEISGTATRYHLPKSQPSWAAWIEIASPDVPFCATYVAALMGCVD